MTKALLAAGLVLAVLVVLATAFGSVDLGPLRILALERATTGDATTVALRPGPGLLILLGGVVAATAVRRPP